MCAFTRGRVMKIKEVFGAVVVFTVLAGCADADMGQMLKNTAAGVADGACRSSSSCSTGVRHDPVSPRPAWQTGGATPKDSPYRQMPSR
jgi:hypothetical protein